MKRRDALKTIGGLAGMAGMSKLLPACGDGDDGPVGITTYVYLMLENRTYDHMLGARTFEGIMDGDGLTMGTTNPDTGGSPIALYNPSPLEMCTMGDPPHGWEAAHAQWNNGANDGFVQQHQVAEPGAKDPMQYLVRDQVPVSWALADAYTTCDRWHASVMGPTLPNRAYWHTGTSFGLKVNNDILSKFSAGVPVPTIYNRLSEKGVDWAYYYGNLAVVSLLGSPGPYQLDLGPNDGTGHIRRFGDALTGGGQFFKDAAAGRLPPVVYIDPAFSENDDHPPVHPVLGQELIAAVYTALANSPQWKNIMLVITYDEHGGFFDHVSPPTTTDDTLEKYGVDGFQQLGFRVPAMVIGPYVKQNGYVSHTLYDHTSALKHLQNAFGLDSINARIDAANDLSDCIDMERLAAGDWAAPVDIPLVDREAWPYGDQRCMGSGDFKIAPPGTYNDPISEWADAHPGGFKPEFDLRGQTADHRMIYEYLAAERRRRAG